jgi:hypothetical protein
VVAGPTDAELADAGELHLVATTGQIEDGAGGRSQHFMSGCRK